MRSKSKKGYSNIHNGEHIGLNRNEAVPLLNWARSSLGCFNSEDQADIITSLKEGFRLDMNDADEVLYSIILKRKGNICMTIQDAMLVQFFMRMYNIDPNSVSKTNKKYYPLIEIAKKMEDYSMYKPMIDVLLKGELSTNDIETESSDSRSIDNKLKGHNQLISWLKGDYGDLSVPLYKCDINQKDEHGKTALMYAIEKGNVEFAEYLIANDAVLDIADSSRKTVRDLIQQSSDQKLRALLNSEDSKMSENAESVQPNTSDLQKARDQHLQFSNTDDNIQPSNNTSTDSKNNNVGYISNIEEKSQYNNDAKEQKALNTANIPLNSTSSTEKEMIPYIRGRSNTSKRGYSNLVFNQSRHNLSNEDIKEGKIQLYNWARSGMNLHGIPPLAAKLLDSGHDVFQGAIEHKLFLGDLISMSINHAHRYHKSEAIKLAMLIEYFIKVYNLDVNNLILVRAKYYPLIDIAKKEKDYSTYEPILDVLLKGAVSSNKDLEKARDDLSNGLRLENDTIHDGANNIKDCDNLIRCLKRDYGGIDLESQQCDINQQDDHGKTALMYAIEENNVEFAKYLIANNAGLDIADKSGKTAVMYAIEKGNVEFAKYLIANNAGLEIADKNGKTVRQLIEESSDQELRALLNPEGSKMPELVPQDMEAASGSNAEESNVINLNEQKEGDNSNVKIEEESINQESLLTNIGDTEVIINDSVPSIDLSNTSSNVEKKQVPDKIDLDEEDFGIDRLYQLPEETNEGNNIGDTKVIINNPPVPSSDLSNTSSNVEKKQVPDKTDLDEDFGIYRLYQLAEETNEGNNIGDVKVVINNEETLLKDAMKTDKPYLLQSVWDAIKYILDNVNPSYYQQACLDIVKLAIDICDKALVYTIENSRYFIRKIFEMGMGNGATEKPFDMNTVDKDGNTAASYAEINNQSGLIPSKVLESSNANELDKAEKLDKAEESLLSIVHEHSQNKQLMNHIRNILSCIPKDDLNPIAKDVVQTLRQESNERAIVSFGSMISTLLTDEQRKEIFENAAVSR